MADNGNSTQSPVTGQRRVRIGFHVILQVLLLLAMVVMANYMAARHYLRFDWTGARYHELHNRTRNILGAMEDSLRVIVFMPGEDEQGLMEKVQADTRNLLREFEFFARGKLQVEYVDQHLDPVRARQVFEDYKLGTDMRDVVIFARGDRSKFVKLEEMIELDRGKNPYVPEPPRMRSFKGEGLFLAAIQSLIEVAPSRVYFLTGHGERDPEDADPERGYSLVKTYLQRDNIQVATWNLQRRLLEGQGLPDDASAVVVAGPKSPYTAPEIEVLERYLANNGRLLVLLDPGKDAGLTPLLRKWGVQLDDNMVMTMMGVLGQNVLVMEALGSEYAAHPITMPLTKINTSFAYSRSVRAQEATAGLATDQAEVTELVRTPASAGFWGETDYLNRVRKFDPDTDLAGPVCVAVAVERSKPAGVDIGSARLVVVGTSSFVVDGYLREWRGNLDFLMNAMNWLLQRNLNIEVGPKMTDDFGIDMTRNQFLMAGALVLAGLPLVVAAIGLMVWLQRRS
jgi:hypothetical protein